MPFVLKSPSGKIETPIMYRHYFHCKLMIISTGEKICPIHWSPTKHRAKPTAPMSEALNTFLDRFEIRVKEIHLRLKSEFVQITPAILKKAVLTDMHLKGQKETLLSFWENFIKEKMANNTKEGSLEVYRSAIKVFKGFPGPKDFMDINPGWFRKFQTYMENYRDQKTVKEGYSPNYIGKTVTIIREVMRVAYRDKKHTNTDFNDPSYKKPIEEVEAIYLSVDELLKIYNVKLSESLSRSRDLFLIGAYTGLRFSDSSKITIEDVREGLIFDRQTKTKHHVVIPVHYVVEEILQRYPDGLITKISNQKVNDDIKEIGKLAGIDTPVVIKKTKGGKTTTITVPKWSLITSHTGRRSAASNMVLAGIPKIQIMKITGHKTEAAFNKYVRISNEENARNLQGHDFFTRPKEL